MQRSYGAVNAIVLWSGRYLPFADLPSHVGLISVLAHGAESGADAYMQRSLAPTPYLLFYLSTAAWAQIVPVEFAAKLNLVITTGGFAVGMAYLAHGCGRSPRIALLASVFLYSSSLRYGFVSFVFGTPIPLFVLGAFERLIREAETSRARRWPRAPMVVLSLGLGLAFLAHGLILLVSAFLLLIRVTFFFADRTFRLRFRRVISSLVVGCLPPLLLMAPYAVERFATPYVSPEFRSARPLFIFNPPASHLESLGAHFLGTASPGHTWTMYALGAIWIGLVALAWRTRRGPRSLTDSNAIALYSVALAIVYVFGPDMLGWPSSFWGVAVRMVPFLLSTLLLVPRVELVGTRWRVFAAASLIVVAHNTVRQLQDVRAHQRPLVGFDRVRASIPPRSRVAHIAVGLGDGLNFYHLCDGAAYVPVGDYSPEVPVRPRRDVVLPHAHSDPTTFDLVAHGNQFDYFVTRDRAFSARAVAARTHDVILDDEGWIVIRTRSARP